MKRSTFLLTGGLVVAAASGALAGEPYADVVAKTAGMVGDGEAGKLAQKHGLQILNVTWEDTGRFKGSSVGDNISDLTIQVKDGGRITAMPVIRFPNFEDVTGDVSLDRFKLLVGNERSGALEPVTLREYLGNIRRYLSTPLSWKGRKTSLLAERDTRALVSAQACFLPIPREGRAEFNPVLFNYQSYPENPAVLAILVTREGTSATVLDNSRDSWGGGQRVFFNQKGERAMLTGERLSDFTDKVQAHARRGEKVDLPDVNLSQVLLIQVPLKQKARPRMAPCEGPVACAPAGAADCERSARRDESNVEAAVVGHGAVEGPFVEMAGLEIERDERFPVRVTVQFYKATSNGVVSAEDMSAIAREIQGVYAKADNVGSLVTQGETGRPTEHAGTKVEYPGWWGDFWARHEKATGVERERMIGRLDRVFGKNYRPHDEQELVEAVSFCGGPVEGAPPRVMRCGTSDRYASEVERAARTSTAAYVAIGALGVALVYLLFIRR